MRIAERKLRQLIREAVILECSLPDGVSINELLGGESGAGKPVSMSADVKSAVRAKSVELANKHAKDAASKTNTSISAAKKDIADMSPEDKKAYLKSFGTTPGTNAAKDPKERAKAAAALLNIAAKDPASGDELNAMLKSNPNLRTVQNVPDMGGLDRAAEEKAKIDNPSLDISKKPGQVWKQLGKIAQNTGLAERRCERVLVIHERDVKDHFQGSSPSKHEMSSQGTYISHVPSMQEDEDDDNCYESLKFRDRLITITR
jgi:hypothetical protein